MITLEAISRMADEAIQQDDTDVQRVLEMIAGAAACGAVFVQIDVDVAQFEEPQRVAAHLRAAGLICDYSERASGQRVLHVQWSE